MSQPAPRPNRQPVRDAIRAVPDGAERARTVARLRATAVRNAIRDSTARDAGGVVTVTTAAGHTVRIQRVELSPESADTAWVDVYLEGQTEDGEAHFRVINPPTLVEDRGGEIIVNGVRHREDPLLALAEVLAGHGGAAR